MSVTLDQLLSLLNSQPENVQFDAVMAVIEENYHFSPTAFSNGLADDVVANAQGTNEGSCRIFSFAQLHGLSVDKTLHCFGTYYRDDVLKSPEGSDHGNIRAFMVHGWSGITFDKPALSSKA
jgi:hypothetical protein